MSLDPLDFSAFETVAAQQSREPGPILRFFIEPTENKAKSAEAGRPIYDNVEMISIINPGSKDEFIKKVDANAKERFGRQYEHWKRTQEQPAEGTPLEMVPFLNPAQVKELRAINIPTLEHLANLTDTAIQKIGMGGLELVRKAQAYLKAAGDNSVVTKLVAENQRLKAEIETLKGQIAQVNQRYENLLAGAVSTAVVQSPQIDMVALAAAVASQLKGVHS
jgi:hypothetical protein